MHGLDAERKQQLLIALTRHLIQQTTGQRGRGARTRRTSQAAVATLHAGAIDLAAAFVPGRRLFWQAHTKAGLASLLHTARSPSGETFAEWYAREHRESATDTQTFARLMNGSRTALIAALVATRFDFSAWVPEVIAGGFRRGAEAVDDRRLDWPRLVGRAGDAALTGRSFRENLSLYQ